MLLSLLCGVFVSFGFITTLTAAETNGYVGAVGEQKMILSLTWHDDGTVGGNYYCPGGSGRVYALRGSNPREGELVLTEYTEGKASAICRFKKSIENGVIVWRGVMSNFDGRIKGMYFYRSKG
jgi:hypothetical protein